MQRCTFLTCNFVHLGLAKNMHNISEVLPLRRIQVLKTLAQTDWPQNNYSKDLDYKYGGLDFLVCQHQ